MKKRNIVRFTAFIMAILMCTSSAVTLFAEGVDSTEESVIEATESVTTEATESPSEESASEAITEDETETQTVSGNETTPIKPTRSELGQKILEFKNSDEYKNTIIFGNMGRVATWDEELGTYVYGEVATDLNDSVSSVGFLQSTGVVDGIYALYYYNEDIIKYVEDADEELGYDCTLVDSDSFDTKNYTNTFGLPLSESLPNDVSFSDYIDNIYICIFDKDSSNLKFVCKYKDFPAYSAKVFQNEDNSEYTITTSLNEDGSVHCKVDYKVSLRVKDMLFNKEEESVEGIWKYYVEDEDGYINLVNESGDRSKNTGAFEFDMLGVTNGEYVFTPYYNANIALYSQRKIVKFTVDCVKDSTDSTTDNVVSDEDLKAATVSFSGMLDEAYTNDSVTLKMNTDKKCKMSFNGVSLANNEYATSADFTVTHNGTYSYTAINEQGVATNGTFEVTFFKDKVTDAINDPLQSDLVSAKTDTTLSQTGLYQTWLIILAVILCSFGILLIVNQKYHFLDKFVRRLKHESN